MPTLAELNVKIGADIANLQRGMRQAEKTLMRSSRNLGQIGDAINRNIVAPFIAASGYGVKLAFDLGTNFSKIENLVGITGTTLDSFKESIKSISNEVGQGQVQLSQALFTVTSAGLRGAEAVDVLKASAKASAIGLGETEEVARATTAVIQAYGKENITAARAVNVLTSIVREGNVEAASLAPALGKILGTASLMGISFEELGANIATFTRLGVSAEQAVDGLQAIMTSMLKPSKEAEKILAEFGLSAEALRRSIRENGLAQTLIFLTEKFKGNEASLAKVVGEVQSFRTIMGTAGVQGKEYIKILDGIENQTSDVDKAFANLAKDPAQKFKVAMEALKNSAIELGQELLPTVVKIIDKVTDLAKGFQSLDPETKKLIVNVGLFATVAGGALKVAAGLASNIGMLIKTARLAIGVLPQMGNALSFLRNASPYLAVAGAFLAIAKGLEAIDKAVGNAPTRSPFDITSYQDDFNKTAPAPRASASALTGGLFKGNDDHKFVRGIGEVAKESKDEVADLVKSMEDLLKVTTDQGKATSGFGDTLKGLMKDLKDAEMKSMVFTDTFAVGSEKSELYRKAINDLLEKGVSPYNIVIRNLKAAMDALKQSTVAQVEPLATFREATAHAKDNVYDISEEMARARDNAAAFAKAHEGDGKDVSDTALYMQDAVAGLGDKLLQAAADGKVSFKSLKAAAIDAAKGMIRAGLAALLKSVFTNIPFPASLLVAGGAIAAGIGLTALLPKAAKGAVVHGPTPIMVGDNPNARVDPEVISPLSKLKQMIGDGMQHIHITGNLVGKGDQLIAVIDQAAVRRTGIRGF